MTEIEGRGREGEAREIAASLELVLGVRIELDLEELIEGRGSREKEENRRKEKLLRPTSSNYNFSDSRSLYCKALNTVDVVQIRPFAGRPRIFSFFLNTASQLMF